MALVADAREALELVGLNLCQAIFHDLEKSTGVNVWTFAQNLAGGWFEQGGDWAPLRAMMDILGGSARAVVDELRGLVALVAQDTYLFNDTLRANILIARPEATEAVFAREWAQAHPAPVPPPASAG